MKQIFNINKPNIMKNLNIKNIFIALLLAC